MTDDRSQLHMRRSLDALPELTLPTGFSIRRFTTGDAPMFADLLNRNGELGEWSDERAALYFGPEARADPNASFFVTRDGEPVATAQLIPHREDRYAPISELGWVAASPAARGFGLGYAVCLAVMRAAADMGHGEIFLLTDDPRLPAIATYFKLGFEPWLIDADAPARWKAVRQALAQQRS